MQSSLKSGCDNKFNQFSNGVDALKWTHSTSHSCPVENTSLSQGGTIATGASTLDELDALLEDVADDDEEKAREAYRAARIAEMKAAAGKPEFGEIINITGNEYVREINGAGKGVFVALLLYRTDLPVCRLLQQHFATLAPKFKNTKFVQSVAQSCIPNYPDKNLPTVFVYHEDDLKMQFTGPAIFGGESMKENDVEWALSCSGALETEMEGNPRTVHKEGANKAPFGMRVTDATRRSLDGKSKKSGSHDSDSSDSDDD
eukprot:gene10827-34236_t